MMMGGMSNETNKQIAPHTRACASPPHCALADHPTFLSLRLCECARVRERSRHVLFFISFLPFDV